MIRWGRIKPTLCKLFEAEVQPKLTCNGSQKGPAADEELCENTRGKGYLRTSRFFKKAEIYRPGPPSSRFASLREAQ